jgi:hypothetical protein
LPWWFAQTWPVMQSNLPRVLWCVLILGACKPDYAEEVSTDVCASGLRWAGDLTGSEEMYPGQDCVGCHKQFDAPELLAAGTIYGAIDPEGTRTTQPYCYGVEGARVTITAGDGRVLQTTTNRAGNFYFEGRESTLVKPLSVLVEYTAADGHRSREPMGTNPSYGGCAHCHSPEAEGTPGVYPGGEPLPDDVIEVYPIFTGPVHE